MKAKNVDWYKHGWTLDIKNQSWVENTDSQVEFIIKTLGLHGDERILDLACGYDRHSLALAKRGFSVVGVDITESYIDDARKSARDMRLDAEFIQSDIRELTFDREFDVVVNLADGEPTRLYTVNELQKILSERGMKILQTFSDFAEKPASPKELQLIVYSAKER